MWLMEDWHFWQNVMYCFNTAWKPEWQPSHALRPTLPTVVFLFHKPFMALHFPCDIIWTSTSQWCPPSLCTSLLPHCKKLIKASSNTTLYQKEKFLDEPAKQSIEKGKFCHHKAERKRWHMWPWAVNMCIDLPSVRPRRELLNLSQCKPPLCSSSSH